MSEPGYCKKCRKDILVGEHKCPSLPARLALHLLAASLQFAATAGQAMTKGFGYAIVFYILWSAIRLDVAVVIGMGIRAAEGLCN
jgi:hypothetical protein